MRYFITLSFCLLTSLAFAATGILELDSQPGGAEVFVDGKKKGVTPETAGQKLTMELAEGDHEIVIKKEGVGSAKKSVFIGEGVIQPLTLTIMAEAFTNALGMKFVPVPGTKVLMCIHETRNKDYAAYAAENRGVDGKWKNVSFELGSKKYTLKDDANHPIVNVFWQDAKDFCRWLSSKDGRLYRLPTDYEWSCAAGIGHLEPSKGTAKTRHGLAPDYAWGASWPPPKHSIGNYKNDFKIVGGETYRDGWEFTAPVMSFPPNSIGLFDIDGNVAEWCESLYSDEPDEHCRVTRGGTWSGSLSRLGERTGLDERFPINRFNFLGFRCVVVIGSSP